MPKGVAYDAVVFQYSMCGVAACFRGFKSFNVYSGVISSLPFLMTAW